MAVEYLKATLQVWRYTGGPPTADQFLGRLVIGAGAGVARVKKPRPRVDLMEIESSDSAEAEEPTESCERSSPPRCGCVTLG